MTAWSNVSSAALPRMTGPRGAQFVGEGGGVLPDGGVGDQAGLWVATPRTERRQPADHAVQGDPPDALSQVGAHPSSLSTGRRSSNRSNSCQM